MGAMRLAGLVFGAALLASVLTASFVLSRAGNQNGAKEETAYERVLRTKTLRCGYADWPPYNFLIDPTTKKMSGVMHDITEAAAERLGIKVDWAEDIGWSSIIESLQSHRIDSFCVGSWRNAERGRYIGFSTPLFYNAVYPYVRVEDRRFDKDLSLIDDPKVKLSIIDGEMSDIIARQHFPKATKVSVPVMAPVTDVLVGVATRKADVVFTEASFAKSFMDANPGQLRAAQDKPFQVLQNSMAFDIHEGLLKEMMDSALVELQNQGVIDKIIAKYTKGDKDVLRVALPYRP